MQTTSEPLEFLIRLARVFSHSITMYSRERVHGTDLFMGGDPPAPTATESTDSMLQAYIKNLPGLLDVTAKNVLPTEQANLQAQQQLAPAQNQLALDLYKQFAPQFNAVGSQISSQNALAQAGSDLQVLQQYGPQLTAQALAAQKQADPEYYKTREMAQQGLANMFNGLPDGSSNLTGGERAEVERSLARDNSARGNENPTAIGTVENAMKFGSAGLQRQGQKQAMIANAVNTASQAMAPMQSKIDTFQLTTGRPSVNSGQTQFAGVKDVGQNTFSMGQNLLGEVGQNQRSAMDINSRRRDSLDRFSQVMSSMPNVSCCFIFLAAHGGELPWWVRYLRNVLADDETRRGYIRMSRWLVPILQRSAFARVITQAAMTYPITEYGAAMVGVRPEGIVFAPIKRFWFAVWKHLGK